jgi:membrane protein DedA with SNARE-associated domain
VTQPEPPTPTPTPAAGRLPPPPKWVRNLVVGLIGFAIVLGWIGDMFWGSLVDRHPLGLILLNAKPRYLLLTSNELDPVSYYVVGTLRLVWTKPLVWLIGAWYGERAIRWAERRWDPRGRVVRPAQRIFGRWGWIVVLVTSTNVVCLLAGASGMPLLLFMALAVVGTLIRLVVIRLVGNVLEQPIDELISVIAANRVLVVVLSITVVIGSILWERRRGRSELGHLASLDEALHDADAEGSPSRDRGTASEDDSAAH